MKLKREKKNQVKVRSTGSLVPAHKPTHKRDPEHPYFFTVFNANRHSIEGHRIGVRPRSGAMSGCDCRTSTPHCLARRSVKRNELMGNPWQPSRACTGDTTRPNQINIQLNVISPTNMDMQRPAKDGPSFCSCARHLRRVARSALRAGGAHARLEARTLTARHNRTPNPSNACADLKIKKMKKKKFQISV